MGFTFISFLILILISMLIIKLLPQLIVLVVIIWVITTIINVIKEVRKPRNGNSNQNFYGQSKQYTDDTRQGQSRENQYTQGSRDPNVIDVEYTTRDITDEKE